jgi:hypothetical protein
VEHTEHAGFLPLSDVSKTEVIIISMKVCNMNYGYPL